MRVASRERSVAATTHHEPKGRTRVSAPYDEINHVPRATSYKLLTAVSSFQRGEPSARASQARPVQSPSLARVVRNNGDDIVPKRDS